MPLLTEEQQLFLSNPFYSALTTHQTACAEHIGTALRYNPAVLPFAAVATADTVIHADELTRDTDACFCGILPRIEAGIPGSIHASCLQMAHPTLQAKAPAPLPIEVELGEHEANEMLALTQVAFPGFFRAQTCKLGRYIGLRDEAGQLVAMAGHRTSMPGLREISAVCTRPGHTGKGYAQHLIQRMLADDGTGATPYLHTLSTNTRAIAIYKALGFVTTDEVPFLKVPQQI